MKYILSIVATSSFLAISPGSAWSQQVIDTYISEIGSEDRVNSRGNPLTKAEQILAQDRANFHRFGIRHPGDTGDQFFGVRDNRAALPGLLERGSLSPDAERAILSDGNSKLMVEVIGRAGRPEALRVTIAQDEQQASDGQTAQAAVSDQGLPSLGALPSLVAGNGQWQFVHDEHEWRGTALAGTQDAYSVALGCTRPGADPARYPGGHIRPHEASVYNLFVAPASLGGNYGLAGAQTFTLELSVDGQSFGAAPVILLAPEMTLATNIPMNHPFIERLRSGGTMTVRDQASGGALDVPLSGSAAALDALAAFCAQPLPELAPKIGNLPNPLVTANAATEGAPTFAPHLSCTLDMRSGARMLYNLNCRSNGGNHLSVPDRQRIQAQLALRTLGCDVPIIDGAPTSANAQCFLELFAPDQESLTDRDIRYLAKQHIYVERDALVSELVKMGLRLAEGGDALAEAGAASVSDEGGSTPAPAPESGASQATSTSVENGIVCEREPWRGSQLRIRCTNSDGSAVETTKLRQARAQYGLQVLGCDVSAITGDVSDSPEAVACFREMFGLDGANLSANEVFDLSAIGEYTDQDQAVAHFKRRGYQLASEQVRPLVPENLVLDDTPATRATLNLPDPRDGEYYQARGYYSSDMNVPLSRSGIFDLNVDTPEAKHGKFVFGYARWLSLESQHISPLFLDEPLPKYSNAGDDIRAIWIEELSCVRNSTSCTKPDARLFPIEVEQALGAGAKVHVCEYDRRRAPGTLLNPNLRGVPGLVIPMHFWAQPMSVEISAEKLTSFSGSETGLHPLLVVGPYLEACPSRLGEALEYIAGPFPELVPLASAPAPQVASAGDGATAGGEAVSSLDDPRQELVRELLGMSLAETNVNVFGGEIKNGTALVVDMVSETGPAYRAGYRSGDYIWVIGWDPVGTINEFVRALERRQDNGAVVMTQSIPGETRPENNTILVPFAQETPERFREVTRSEASEAERPGWTTLAEDEYGISMSVYGDPWCGEIVEAEYAQPLDADQVAYTNSNTFRAGFDAIQAQCSDIQKLFITSISATLNAEINKLEVDFTTNPPTSTKLGLDGLPPGSTVRETRKIAQENAPLCDRLAAHPADSNRRYGLEGVEFMLPDTLEEAITACIAAIEENPDDPVTNFQLGRALYEAGLGEDALGFFEVAAASGHGGAFDYLGQMYYDGNGVEQDYELGDSYFDQALQAGFDPFAEPEKITFDTTGSVIASWFLEYNYDMDIKLMPFYANRTDVNVGSEYNPTTLRALYHVTKRIAEACTDQGTIDGLIAALEEDGADIDQLEHAVFMYENYLPNMIPLMAQKVGVSTTEFSAPAGETAIALTNRYECQSVQLRQFVLNAVELIVR